VEYDEEDKNPRQYEEWDKKMDWGVKAVADFDQQAAKSHAERAGELARSGVDHEQAAHSKGITLDDRETIRATVDMTTTCWATRP
jgi:hypothetical protein